MNWKNRLKNYNFWISIFSAVLLILQALKIKFDIAYVNEIFTAVLGLLVVIGIISDPTRTTVKSSDLEHITTKLEKAKAEKEEPIKEVEQAKEEEKENVLPIEYENETNNVNNQNDIKTAVDKIALDIDEKIKELKNFNNEVLNILQSNKTLQEQQNKETLIPAAAEMENPYLDVMN